MKIITKELIYKTKGDSEIIDLTLDLNKLLIETKLSEGNCTVFSIGSTGGITTLEYEPGLLKDIPSFLDKIIPKYEKYFHNDTWGDGNGHSHIRSAIFKTSLTIPFAKKLFFLGTWQQVVFIDFDNRPRTRRIIAQFIGE
ncbi:MAG TPA: secondary thiamine-phosphate synthase enzyme YjbQ [Ignavibacteria bacterium]|nr:secondary thiamine-phosphate synthase enzyme YjbQ [Ignavibacteria bacterium]